MKILLHLSAVCIATHMKDDEYKDYYERKMKEGKYVMCIMNGIREKLVYRIFSVKRQDTSYTKQNLPVSK